MVLFIIFSPYWGLLGPEYFISSAEIICAEVYIKNCHQALKNIGLVSGRSGKNLFRIPYRGVKKAPDSGSATLARGVKIFAENNTFTAFSLNQFFNHPSENVLAQLFEHFQ